jgi:hypothetical protein
MAAFFSLVDYRFDFRSTLLQRKWEESQAFKSGWLEGRCSPAAMWRKAGKS